MKDVIDWSFRSLESTREGLPMLMLSDKSEWALGVLLKFLKHFCACDRHWVAVLVPTSSETFFQFFYHLWYASINR